jgi:hypothetical protein
MFPEEYCIPFHHGLARPHAADEEDGLETPIATIISNKHYWTIVGPSCSGRAWG